MISAEEISSSFFTFNFSKRLITGLLTFIPGDNLGDSLFSGDFVGLSYVPKKIIY